MDEKDDGEEGEEGEVSFGSESCHYRVEWLLGSVSRF